jgi:hypothetical protein
VTTGEAQGQGGECADFAVSERTMGEGDEGDRRVRSVLVGRLEWVARATLGPRATQTFEANRSSKTQPDRG